MKLIFGDCLEEMAKLKENSIDLCLTDPPYGKTACAWDKVIDFTCIWKALSKLTKNKAAVLFFGIEPFSSNMRLSNIKQYKYDMIWEKNQGSLPMNAPYRPIITHENISVFSSAASTYSKKGSMSYYPIKTEGKPYKGCVKKSENITFHTSPIGYSFKGSSGARYPKSVLPFSTERGKHPTQKPVALLEYLIKTYTKEGETVLDFTMGSGSTGVACKNTNRKFIGIENNKKYYDIAVDRIK